MYNFLDHKLLPKVTSDTSSLEHYEVTNLINSNDLVRARGFIADQVTKPPIEITFQLICPVNIHYLILSTVVGTLKCTAIEISAKYTNNIFTPIAYAKYESSGVIFCNGRLYSTTKLPDNIDREFHLTFFKSKSFRSFTTANEIKITILRTNNRVPCLGKIEVWGKPSKICSTTTVDTINRLMCGAITNVKEEKCVSTKELIADDFEIPDEFKDALTIEIMAIPITLPSGNTIDQSTLEKFVGNEAVYGRPASDPFTSQPFTSSRKPVLNVALKSRIDMFLLKNADKKETFTVKRTVGQKLKSVEPLIINSEEVVTAKRKGSDEDSLEEAIRKVKKSATFISFTQNLVEAVSYKCELCDKKDYLFVIPCKHVYCRDCMIELCVELKCKKCDTKFYKNDAARFYP